MTTESSSNSAKPLDAAHLPNLHEHILSSVSDGIHVVDLDGVFGEIGVMMVDGGAPLRSCFSPPAGAPVGALRAQVTKGESGRALEIVSEFGLSYSILKIRLAMLPRNRSIVSSSSPNEPNPSSAFAGVIMG